MKFPRDSAVHMSLKSGLPATLTGHTSSVAGLDTQAMIASRFRSFPLTKCHVRVYALEWLNQNYSKVVWLCFIQYIVEERNTITMFIPCTSQWFPRFTMIECRCVWHSFDLIQNTGTFLDVEGTSECHCADLPGTLREDWLERRLYTNLSSIFHCADLPWHAKRSRDWASEWKAQSGHHGILSCYDNISRGIQHVICGHVCHPHICEDFPLAAAR